MGFGTSMTQAIFFIASALIALAIVGVATMAVSSMMNSFSSKAGYLSDEIKTGVKISGDSCFLSNSHYVYVKNTGSTFLDANSTDVFVGGGIYSVSAIDIFKSNAWAPYSGLNIWEPGELVRFTTASALPAGYNRLRVVTQYGVYDSLEYTDC